MRLFCSYGANGASGEADDDDGLSGGCGGGHDDWQQSLTSLLWKRVCGEKSKLKKTMRKKKGHLEEEAEKVEASHDWALL